MPCDAQELPLNPEQEGFFDLKAHAEVVAKLASQGKLLQSADGRAWFARSRFPQKELNIRGVGESFAIFQKGKKRPLGHIDGPRALRECHTGAVYLHKADTFGVERLDLERKNVWVSPIEPHYFTRILSDKETEILEVLATRQVARFTAHIGRLKVTEHLLSYEKRRLPGRRNSWGGWNWNCRPRSLKPWACGWKSLTPLKALRMARGSTSWGASTPWSTS